MSSARQVQVCRFADLHLKGATQVVSTANDSSCQLTKVQSIINAGGIAAIPEKAGGSDVARVRRTVTIRIRRPVHITLARVPSSQAGTPPYKICLDRHNLVFCTCNGWRYNGHSCPHLTAFRSALASAAEQVA